MKKFFVLFITILILTLFVGCAFAPEEPTEEEESGVISEESSKIEPQESNPLPEFVLEFIESEYTVTATSEAATMKYETTYYLIDGLVAGAKAVTTFTDGEQAKEYYELMSDKYGYAKIDGFSVVYYVAEDDGFYYGYSYEKLRFVLDKMGYTVTISFDEDEFSSDKSKESKG